MTWNALAEKRLKQTTSGKFPWPFRGRGRENGHSIDAKNPGRHAQMRREKVRVTLMVCSIVLAGVAFASNARAERSRKTLQKLADTYVKAQTAGKASMLPLAQDASYAEN